jgi:acyl-CoA thioesterase-1
MYHAMARWGWWRRLWHLVFPPRRNLTAYVLPMILVGCLAVACGAQTVAQGPASVSHEAPAAAPVASGTPSPTLTYVAIGASDAFGIGTQDPQTQSWPADLSRALGGPVHLINLGIPSATADVAQRDEVPVALAMRPALVTIWLGVNDFDDNVPLATFSRQLQTIITTLKQNGSPVIYVGNLPDLALLPSFKDRDPIALEQQIQAWNASIAAICVASNVTLVDIYTTWSELGTHPDYIAADGLHPSTLGAQKIADLFATTIHDTASLSFAQP